jgi:penicillin-binding protein 1A
MKKCYDDRYLDVSNEPFEKPENLSIKVDCWTPKKEVDTTAIVPTDEPSMDEFGL